MNVVLSHYCWVRRNRELDSTLPVPYAPAEKELYSRLNSRRDRRTRAEKRQLSVENIDPDSEEHTNNNQR